MSKFVSSPSPATLKIISDMPEFKQLTKKWQADKQLGIDVVREMMRYSQEIVRVNRTTKVAKARDALESIVSKHEMGK